MLTHPQCRVQQCRGAVRQIAGWAILSPALIIAAVLVLPTLVLAQSSSNIAAVHVDANVMLRMRDGVRLATDVYRPASGASVPAILVRTPYGKDSLTGDGMFFAQHGYAYIAQDTRGRFKSEGSFQPYVQDDADGRDTAGWLNAQPWFDHQRGFGVLGDSYMASTALSLAEMDPPNLKAAYLSFASASYHDDGAWRGGAFQLAHNVFFTVVTACPQRLERAAPATAHTPLKLPLPGAGDIGALFALESATPLDQRLLADNCPWYHDWLTNSDENWYWDQMGLNHAAYFDHLPPIPIAFMTGWYDQFLGGTLVDYQGAPADTSLTIGPWVHEGMDHSTAGDAYFGQAANEDRFDDELHWFNRYLHGGDASGPQPGTVRYFLMGGGTTDPAQHLANGQIDVGGTWQTAPAWPPPDVQSAPYYFHADGSLSTDRPGREVPDTYAYDPVDPVPTIGGNISSGAVFAPAGAYIQRCRRDWPACRGSTDDLASRADVLSFQTDPLDQDLAVVGAVSVELWASTDAPDTDFTAKLLDVYPDGDAVNVADGILRARYREGTAEAQFVSPGVPSKYVIDLWHTAMLFKAGHRLRVDISSSNFPHFDRNLNTGFPIGTDALDDAVVATQTVFHDSLRASRIVLPVLPTD
jgi:uncharacterized protein